MEDGELHLEDKITRAQLCRIVAAVMRLGDGYYASISYTDINENHWAYPYISMLSSLGILNGNPDGSFNPDSPVTYQEAVKTVSYTHLSGDSSVFVDKFKFAETIADCAEWSTAVQYNVDNKTVCRVNASDEVYATYKIDELITGFSVDIPVSYTHLKVVSGTVGGSSQNKK